MSKIEAIIGGKAKGKADQVAIDLALGCKNKCVGCYAKKSCQRGDKYDRVTRKELDKAFLTRSIRLVQSKGFQLARIGKHCDPGDHINSLNGVLDCCNNERFRCIVVSKSLKWNKKTAELLSNGNHVLHISLGPYTQVAPKERDRLITAGQYINMDVQVAIRLTRDITQSMDDIDKTVVRKYPYIVTPMRYASRNLMNFYEANEDNYEFVDGYYRPKTIHSDWEDHMDNVCGEIDGEVRCCNCLIDF